MLMYRNVDLNAVSLKENDCTLQYDYKLILKVSAKLIDIRYTEVIRLKFNAIKYKKY
jgi:hypothetical protein